MQSWRSWGLATVPVVMLAGLALGGALGGAFGHRIGLLYNPPRDPIDSVGQVDYALLGTLIGLLSGLLIGLALSLVILTEHRRDEEE